MKMMKSFIKSGLMCCGIAAALASCNAAQKGYVVTGEVEGLADSTVLELVPLSHEKEEPLAEAIVLGGKFELTGEVSEPICVHLKVKDAYGYHTLMVDPTTKATITGSVTEGKAWDGTPQYGWNTKTEGSPLTDEFNTLAAEREQLNKLYADNQEKFKDVHAKLGTLKGKELDDFKKGPEYWALSQSDSIFFHTADSVINGLILRNKDNIWGPIMAVYNMSYFTPDQREIFNQFSDEAKNSFLGKKMREELWPSGGVGDKIKAFTLKDEAGKEYTFEQLAQGKKYVLIDFWASWCAPCRKEIPNVKAQYAKYKDKGFEVVSISIDRDANAWKKALEEEQLQWPNFLSTEVADQFKVKAVPTMILVDAEGTIVAENENARGENLANKLAELLP